MFLFFHGILSDTPKKSRGKNLQPRSQGLSSGGDKRGDPGNKVEKFTDVCMTGGMQNPFTAPFNNMRTLKFEAQPTNGFFAAVNQVFGGSS